MQPYAKPYQVLAKRATHFKLDMWGREKEVSVDCIKPHTAQWTPTQRPLPEEAAHWAARMSRGRKRQHSQQDCNGGTCKAAQEEL